MSQARLRRALIFEMRQGGTTFREIGEKLGISRSRAGQLYAMALLDLSRLVPDQTLTIASPLACLPVSYRARSALMPFPELQIGYFLRLEAPERATHLLPIPNFGRAQLNEVEAALSSLDFDTNGPE
jgi:hypothetical protein